MRTFGLIALFLATAVTLAATAGDAGRAPQPRSPKLEWRAIPLTAKSVAEAKRQALANKGLELRRAPPAIPLVATPRPDGTLDIHHRRRGVAPADRSEESRR